MSWRRNARHLILKKVIFKLQIVWVKEVFSSQGLIKCNNGSDELMDSVDSKAVRNRHGGHLTILLPLWLQKNTPDMSVVMAFFKHLFILSFFVFSWRGSLISWKLCGFNFKLKTVACFRIQIHLGTCEKKSKQLEAYLYWLLFLFTLIAWVQIAAVTHASEVEMGVKWTKACFIESFRSLWCCEIIPVNVRSTSAMISVVEPYPQTVAY